MLRATVGDVVAIDFKKLHFELVIALSKASELVLDPGQISVYVAERKLVLAYLLPTFDESWSLVPDALFYQI